MGVDAGADLDYGTGDDLLVAAANANIAKIASIRIGGQVIGTTDDAGDQFGFVSRQIGALTIGKTKFKLTGGNDTIPLGPTFDFTVRETTA